MKLTYEQIQKKQEYSSMMRRNGFIECSNHIDAILFSEQAWKEEATNQEEQNRLISEDALEDKKALVAARDENQRLKDQLNQAVEVLKELKVTLNWRNYDNALYDAEKRIDSFLSSLGKENDND